MPQRALKKIKALCKGNGVKLDDIKTHQVNGEVVNCVGITHIELASEVRTENKKGQVVVGKLVESPEQIKQGIDESSKALLSSESSRKKIAELLMERPDQGFASHGEVIELDALNDVYCMHKPCNQCGGNSRMACNRCNGRKQEICSQCHGKSMIPCNFCSATGQMQGPDGKHTQCNRCMGERMAACPLCRRTGHISCRQCKGQGNITCAGCAGDGWFTDITMLHVKIKTLFEIDRTTIPNLVVPMIENNGGALVEKGHVRVKSEAVKRKDGGLALQYATKFPFADFSIGLGKHNITFSAFGYNCKMLKVPDFLDKLISPGLGRLNKAAQGEGSAADLIKGASKYRLLNKAITLGLTKSKKQAFMELKKSYPFGVSDKRLQQAIILSNRAFANVTRKPRYIGLGIGLALSAAIFAGYYLGPLRAKILPMLNNETVQMAVDLGLIAIGGVLSALMIKVVAKKSMQDILNDIGINNMKGGGVKTGKSGLYGFIGSAILLLIIVEITRHIGAVTPSWYPLK